MMYYSNCQLVYLLLHYLLIMSNKLNKWRPSNLKEVDGIPGRLEPRLLIFVSLHYETEIFVSGKQPSPRSGKLTFSQSIKRTRNTRSLARQLIHSGIPSLC